MYGRNMGGGDGNRKWRKQNKQIIGMFYLRAIKQGVFRDGGVRLIYRMWRISFPLKTRLPACGGLSSVKRESPPTVPRTRADALWRNEITSARIRDKTANIVSWFYLMLADMGNKVEGRCLILTPFQLDWLYGIFQKRSTHQGHAQISQSQIFAYR